MQGKKTAPNRIILCADKYRIFCGLIATVTFFFFYRLQVTFVSSNFISEKKYFMHLEYSWTKRRLTARPLCICDNTKVLRPEFEPAIQVSQ